MCAKSTLTAIQAQFWLYKEKPVLTYPMTDLLKTVRRLSDSLATIMRLVTEQEKSVNELSEFLNQETHFSLHILNGVLEEELDRSAIEHVSSVNIFSPADFSFTVQNQTVRNYTVAALCLKAAYYNMTPVIYGTNLSEIQGHISHLEKCVEKASDGACPNFVFIKPGNTLLTKLEMLRYNPYVQPVIVATSSRDISLVENKVKNHLMFITCEHKLAEQFKPFLAKKIHITTKPEKKPEYVLETPEDWYKDCFEVDRSRICHVEVYDKLCLYLSNHPRNVCADVWFPENACLDAIGAEGNPLEDWHDPESGISVHVDPWHPGLLCKYINDQWHMRYNTL